MKALRLTVLLLAASLFGCETTNSIPYKPSTDNVILIQDALKDSGNKIRLNPFSITKQAEEGTMCRLMGPINVAPGKSIPEYIKEAFQDELFLAHKYATDGNVTIDGRIDELSFSSVSPAYWDIKMTVSSNKSSGYQVSTHYRFDTSFSAYSACQNVANAFGPAVQSLIKKIIQNPGFRKLVR